MLQNNNRGGYNAGDATKNAAGNNEGNQYRMVSQYSQCNIKSSFVLFIWIITAAYFQYQ